jgi:hypothetical protein
MSNRVYAGISLYPRKVRDLTHLACNFIYFDVITSQFNHKEKYYGKYKLLA